MPGLPDHRLEVEALDQHAGLVVHREVHRPDHAVAAALAQPAPRRRRAARAQDLRVLLELEEAEHAPRVVVVVVEGAVDLGADPAHHAAVAAGEEELRLAVLEEGVEARAQEQVALELERGDPGRPVSMQPERQIDEFAPVRQRADRADLNRHGAPPYMPTAIDLFEKARRHERLEQLQRRARARPDALLPGARGPSPARWCRWRAASGSCSAGNNYLGLTGDDRVKEAAREALDHYGTGVTGSRFMNGTLPIHLELERELADWMGRRTRSSTPPATSPTWARSPRCSTPATPSSATRGDHASILDAVSMSRARVRPFRHSRLDKLETMLVARRVRRRRRAGGGRRRLLDGGRPRHAARGGARCAASTAPG